MTGCQSYKVIQMELLRPSYIDPLVGINGVLLIDNAGYQPDSIGHWLVLPDSTGKEQEQPIIARSADAKPLLLGFLRDKLLDLGYYTEVDTASNDWFPSYKDRFLDFLSSEPLTSHQRAFIWDHSHARMWVSLETWQLKSETRVRAYLENVFSGVIYTAVRDVYATTVWRVYDAWSDTSMAAFVHKDTLFWERTGLKPEAALEALPTIDSTLAEIADYMTGRLATVLSPYWDLETRICYTTGSYRMKYAHDAIKVEDWEKAAELWREGSEKEVGRSAYRAAMNLVLHHERLDEPEEALVWVRKAEALMGKPLSLATVGDKELLFLWGTSLERRLEELKRLRVD